MEEIDSTTPASKDTDAKSFATETLPPSEDVKYADKLSDIQSSEEEGEIASAGEDNSTAPVGRRCYMDLEVKGESSEVKPMEAAERYVYFIHTYMYCYYLFLEDSTLLT